MLLVLFRLAPRLTRWVRRPRPEGSFRSMGGVLLICSLVADRKGCEAKARGQAE